MTSEKLIKIGQACFGRSWKAQLADHLSVDRRRVTDWIDRDSVPAFVDEELSRILEARYFEIKKIYEEEMMLGGK